MRSTPRSLLSVLVLGLAASACTFAPGEPWAVLDVGLELRFDPSAREGDDGRLRTATDYALELDEVSLGVDALRLTFAEDTAPVVFDEANPPEGYTLCHGGHCHSEDGRLVDYEDILRELEGGPVEPPGLAMPVRSAFVLGAEAAAVPLDCGDCALPATLVDDARLELVGLRLTGRAFDARGGRLPDEGVDFDLVTNEPVTATVELDQDIGPWSSPNLKLELRYTLPVGVLDLDWADPDPSVYPELIAFDDEGFVAEIER